REAAQAQRIRRGEPVNPTDTNDTIPASDKSPRIWPPALLLGIFWIVYSAIRWSEWGVSLGFTGFLAVFGTCPLTTLLFAGWWLRASRIGWRERLGIFGVAIIVGAGVALLADKSALGFMVMPGLPLVLTAWTLGFALVRNWRPRPRALVVASILCL